MASRNDAKRGSDGKLDEERERGSRRERGGRAGRGSHHRRQSAADVDTSGMRKVKSRENFLHVEPQGSRSRQESPSHRETSRSPSLTPLHGDSKKDSPRTERRNIINKLKKIAREESPMSSDAETTEKSQLVEALSSVGGQRERESELESSLDFHGGILAVGSAAVVPSGSTGEEPASVNINSPLEAILTAMESET